MLCRRIGLQTRLKILFLLSGVPLLLCFVFLSEPVRIMAIGDSITQGGKRDVKEYTYRLPLQMILSQHNIVFDFVGSRTEGLHDDATWPNVAEGVVFDPDHDGYYGNKTVDAVRKTIIGYNQTIPPDIVLVHLGTNDQKLGDFEYNVGQPLRELINFLRTKNPKVVVLLGHLNFNNSESALTIRKVVEQVATDLSTNQSPVKTVHHYQGWYENPEHIYADTFDWAHPNLKGQEKMARSWWKAMQPYLL
ncbi:MAG: GDSL-type esterase/lipase family protein [Tunicatimonas sp.]|uniref:GDSL-type esterase/lipase family protein n=1 Tax=Tunicatimonas sp. TaxID=1940096 RepID=UPI003C70B4E9